MCYFCPSLSMWELFPNWTHCENPIFSNGWGWVILLLCCSISLTVHEVSQMGKYHIHLSCRGAHLCLITPPCQQSCSAFEAHPWRWPLPAAGLGVRRPALQQTAFSPRSYSRPVSLAFKFYLIQLDMVASFFSLQWVPAPSKTSPCFLPNT